MEWQKQNQFNSFNSWKGLLYAPQYAQVAKGEIPIPIEASIDPIHACNLKCAHCNAARYMVGEAVAMPEEHLLNLVEFLAGWGVKAVCYGGGGEPTLHKGLVNAIIMAAGKGMEVGIATNGTLIGMGEIVAAMGQICRWVGVSVDAATEGVYERLKGRDLFANVLLNIRRLVRESEKGKCDVCYKFLISSVNQGEVFEACRIAKELGVRDFHARPADPRHQGAGEAAESLAQVDVERVLEQFDRCHEIETEQFRVFTVVHKFDPKFLPVKNFTQCYSAPLAIQCCADGKVYFCVDQRQQEEFVLGEHFPEPKQILEFWGGGRHKELVYGGVPARCNTRCTFGVYAEQCERVFVKRDDPMCWKFT